MLNSHRSSHDQIYFSPVGQATQLLHITKNTSFITILLPELIMSVNNLQLKYVYVNKIDHIFLPLKLNDFSLEIHI